ncbi:MAG: amidohydrolase family protein [Nitrospiria bacterium]
MKKIDVHCHSTNRRLEDVAQPDASLDAIEIQMSRYDIARTIVLASYFPQEGSGISNFRALHWLKDRPQFSLFGSLDFETYFYQGLNELEELAAAGLIRGIKLYPAYQAIDFESGKFEKIARLAGRYNLTIMIHGGVSAPVWKKWGTKKIMALANTSALKGLTEGFTTPQEIETAVRAFPAVSFIVSHLCKPFFDGLISLLNRYENAFTDTSGLMDSKHDIAHKPVCVAQVRRMIGECGPEKVLFGTDFPVQSHADAIDILEAAMRDYSTKDKQKVYFENAERRIFQKPV